MSKVLFSIMFVLLAGLSSCDHSKKMVEHEWLVYHAVMEHGDITTAISSLNRIVAIEKYNGNALDTLAILYLQSGANDAATKIAFRALNVKQSDGVLRVLAKANKNLGKYDLALESYAKLLSKTPNNLQLLYEVAFANINLNKLDEALPHIQSIISHPESGTAVMQEFINEGSQLLPYKAIAYNMLGFIQTRTGQSEAAIKSYETAIQIFPKYYLANNNLKLLRKQLAAK